MTADIRRHEHDHFLEIDRAPLAIIAKTETVSDVDDDVDPFALRMAPVCLRPSCQLSRRISHARGSVRQQGPVHQWLLAVPLHGLPGSAPGVRRLHHATGQHRGVVELRSTRRCHSHSDNYEHRALCAATRMDSRFRQHAVRDASEERLDLPNPLPSAELNRRFEEHRKSIIEGILLLLAVGLRLLPDTLLPEKRDFPKPCNGSPPQSQNSIRKNWFASPDQRTNWKPTSSESLPKEEESGKDTATDLVPRSI